MGRGIMSKAIRASERHARSPNYFANVSPHRMAMFGQAFISMGGAQQTGYDVEKAKHLQDGVAHQMREQPQEFMNGFKEYLITDKKTRKEKKKAKDKAKRAEKQKKKQEEGK
tara:strand:- start:3666 stop:4001 length:336 start_codon:yes stop_codon:yes gene_type:complete